MIIQKTIEINNTSEIPVIIASYKSQIYELLRSKQFINFVAQIVSNHVIDIASNEVGTINYNTISNDEINTYLSSFDTQLGESSFKIINDAEVDLASKRLSPTTRDNYQGYLSLSQLIEYGMGYTGKQNTIPYPDNWEYDVNNHGYKGWYYEDASGVKHWTNGMEGRLIFLKIMYWVNDNLPRLVDEFIKNNIKD